MKGRIKVNGKPGNLENNITVECVKSTVTITSDIPFSKRLVFIYMQFTVNNPCAYAYSIHLYKNC
jgi:hypothetical protein